MQTLLPLLYASCFGGEFSSALLAAAVGTTESDLRSVLEQFAEHSFIYEVCPGVYKVYHSNVMLMLCRCVHMWLCVLCGVSDGRCTVLS